MRIRTVSLTLAGAALLLGLLALGFAAYAWHPAISPVQPPRADAFDPALVRRGADLAAIGNCDVCHTAPGGRAYAGGLAIPTPFGTVHSTNITPDGDTGIGRWSEAAFLRSMRAGLDREGRHLYPAFPYDHFTLVSDEDSRALYAFLMTRDPVPARAPQNSLPWPLSQRWVLAGWKLLFFREGAFRPDTTRGAEWNRGAYLAEGLGHCGACHTPRNALGAERRAEAHFAGGEAEGWHAYALNADSPAAVPWDAAAMATYLRQGWQERHGIARGSMAPVVGNLASVPEADTRAIAEYVVSGMGAPSAEKQRRAAAVLQQASGGGSGTRPASGDSQDAPAAPGSQDRNGTTIVTMWVSQPGAPGSDGPAIYAAACASCHEAGRPLPFGGMHLALSTGVTGPTPRNLLNVVLDGLPASAGERAPIMPGFRGVLDDAQLVALLGYLRVRFGGRPPWDGLDAAVRDAQGRNRASSRPMVTSQAAPAEPSKP